MAIDKLQDKIRKMKNPSMLDFSLDAEKIPPHILQEESDVCAAYERFCRELLTAFKSLIPAVRFSLSRCILMGAGGLIALERLTEYATELGYYVLLDIPESLSEEHAERNAKKMLRNTCAYKFDGLLITPYIGSDTINPYAQYLEEKGKDLFVVLRTPNKTASQLQDLLSGSRLVHMAAADIVNRQSEKMITRCGYSRMAVTGPANVADILKKLRARYSHFFILVDGYDYSNANAKNCSYAFDKLGHGAIVCANTGILTAWNPEVSDGTDYVQCALEAAERMKKNLLRYITIL